MDSLTRKLAAAGFGAFALCLLCGPAGAKVDGIPGPVFHLAVKKDRVTTGDSNSIMFWGYTDLGGSTSGLPQYPGPTLIVDEGATVTVTLRNDLPLIATPAQAENVSIVFPGQEVSASDSGCGVNGLLAREVPPGVCVVTYSFTADHPGTYIYHSGTHADLQVEMGLVGALIVRPSGTPGRAYGDSGTAFDREHLFVMTEMDPRIHDAIEYFGLASLEGQPLLSNYFPVYWFVNGRGAPDTMAEPFDPWFPTQPYNALPRLHPGEKLLIRLVSAGRQMHPFHHHGAHARVIAKDGRLLQSGPGAGVDLSYEGFTITGVPGETVDALFEWTGEKLGWDIYGTSALGASFIHSCSGDDGDGSAADGDSGLGAPGPGPAAAAYFDPASHEYCPDHGRPIPVALPQLQDLIYGGFWSGSPYLGTLGSLPPGEGGLNPTAGFTFMWHSHTEKELTNYDIFPGGLMAMLIVEAPGVPIP